MHVYTGTYVQNRAIAEHKCNQHLCVCVCLCVCYMDLVHGFLMELEQLVLNRSSCVNAVVAFQFGV